jgi:SAM-dependent methyltransferase
VLDIGARDGHFSRLLTEYFPAVTALDLKKPEFEHPGVTTVAGDVTRLAFPDNSFDCVFCAEVLEHIPALEAACSEIHRVAAREVIIGVPYRQDIRVGKTTCQSCGKSNPPWGHVNSFDERRLQFLFRGMNLVSTTYVGTNSSGTNVLSSWLMDLAGNPWGTYGQDEYCIHCGRPIGDPPTQRSVYSRMCSKLAYTADHLQSAFLVARANWIHTIFEKPSAA